MQITRITVGVSATVQPRSFENIRREVSLEAELGEGDDAPEDALEELLNAAKWALAESLISELKARFGVADLWNTNSREALHNALKRNSIFEAIAGNEPELAERVLSQFWDELEPILETRKREEAEREAERERRQAELGLAEPEDDEPDDLGEDEYDPDDLGEDDEDGEF